MRQIRLFSARRVRSTTALALLATLLTTTLAPIWLIAGAPVAHAQLSTGPTIPSPGNDSPGPAGSSSLNGILDCVEAAEDGSFRAYLSTLNNSGAPQTVPAGSTNPPNLIAQGAGQFTVPTGFPSFPPTDWPTGRTPYYPDARYQILVNAGATVVWQEPSGTETLSVNALPCSYHIFPDKDWIYPNGQTTKTPPADLPASYRIVVTGEIATDGTNTSFASTRGECTYPRPGGVPTAPLQCTYTNPQPPALDNQGVWLQNATGRTYTVTEENLPAPWVSANTGSFTLPTKGCVPGVVPGYTGINKYCLHTITNRQPTPTPTITPGGPTLTPTTGPTATPTPTPGTTSTATATGAATATATATVPLSPTASPPPAATNTPGGGGGGGGGDGGSNPSPTRTPTPTPTPSATLTPLPTATSTATAPSPAPTATPAPMPAPAPEPTAVTPEPPPPTEPPQVVQPQTPAQQTAVAIQTAIAQGTPSAQVLPGLPGTGRPGPGPTGGEPPAQGLLVIGAALLLLASMGVVEARRRRQSGA